MKFKYEGSNTSGAFAWYFQRVTGLVLFIQVLMHFFIAHETWDAGHNYTTIIDRLSNPYMRSFYLLFIILGLYHGLNGLWSVIRDYNLSAGLRSFLFGAVVVIGIALGMLGVLTMLTLPVVH